MGSKEKLLVEVAKMYYYYGYNQKKIAEILGFSRAYVCQLLDTARREGIVEIKIKDFYTDGDELQQWIQEEYKIKRAMVFKNQDFLTKEKMIAAMAREVGAALGDHIKAGDTIAFSWGDTLFNISREMDTEIKKRDIKVIPLSGGMGNIQHNIHMSEISTNLAEIFDGVPFILPLPLIVENSGIKEAICSDSSIIALEQMYNHADIAVFTVGSPGEDNAIFRSGFINREELKRLKKNGLVGDLCAHFLDKDGEICDPDFESRTISIALDRLKKIPLKICVVYDVSKAPVLCSILKKGYIDYLFVDEATVHLMKYTDCV